MCVYTCVGVGACVHRQMVEWFSANGFVNLKMVFHAVRPNYTQSVYNFQWNHVRSTFGGCALANNNNRKKNFPIPKRSSTTDPMYNFPLSETTFSLSFVPSPIKIVKFFMLKSSITWMAKIVKMKCYYVEKCWKFFAK